MKKSAYLLIATCAAFMSCTEGEEFSSLSPTISNVKQIVATIEPFIVDDGVSTRTTFNNTDGKFYWAATDTIGIFPNSGDQVSFPIKNEMAGQTTVDFNGGGWDLKADSTYFAYFPFSRKNFWGYKAKNEVKITFLGQKQKGKDNADFADTYPLVSYGVNNNGNVHFGFKHMASIAVFTVTAPKPATFTKAVLTTEDGAACFIQEGTYDLSKVTTSSVPEINAKSYGSSITLDLESVTTTTENESFTIFITVPPTAALTSSVKLILTDGESNTYYGYPDREIAQLMVGTRYKRNFAIIPSSASDDYIDFADYLVKKICVENWDTNGDGELSYAEASTITSISTIFNQSQILSFEELKYFTGLTSISNLAFRNCQNLIKIELPANIITIGERAFEMCYNLKSIILPENLRIIEKGVFSNCNKLPSIQLPDHLQSIGASAFAACWTLNNIVLPSSLTLLPNNVFQACQSLENIIIPQSVKSIGKQAFLLCNNLVNVILHNGIDFIDDEAFRECKNLESITIPQNITKISTGLFNQCSKLNNIIIPSNVETIIDYAFSACDSLSNIVIPNSVTTIGDGAFSGCPFISFIIPDKVKEIGNSTFSRCKNLNDIIIPNSVESIGAYAFSGCISLESINLPDKLTSIREYTFMDCMTFSKIIIPSKVFYIGLCAFDNCQKLEEVICEPTEAPIINSSIFNNINTDFIIYVPEESVNLYKNAEGWSQHANRITSK